MAALFGSKVFIAVASAIGSIIVTLLTQQVLNRRGRFRYFVSHYQVGLSADDAIFGSVRVTWNGNMVANLFSSTAELVNESMRDYANIAVRVFTTDTVLLTERTEIVGTTHALRWTDAFSQRLHVPLGQEATQEQLQLYGGQRDYFIPTMNRGQIVRFTFLNAARFDRPPTIWLDVLHPGVKLEFRVAHNQIFGVPQPAAALVGCLLGIVILAVILAYVHTLWLAAVTSLIYGFFAQIPGALTIRAWRRLQQLFGG